MFLAGGDGFRMQIDNVQADDEGVYKCEASSGVASPVFELINLHVGCMYMYRLWWGYACVYECVGIHVCM